MTQDGREDISGQAGSAGMDAREGRSGQRRVGEVLAEVGDDIATEARALRDAAGETVANEADAVRDEAVRALDAFSQSLRSARGQVEGQRLGFVADMLTVAAGRVAGLARSVEAQSSAEMIDTVREHARRNPAGFAAVAALAGFALGRVATVPRPDPLPAGRPGPVSARPAGWPAAGTLPGRVGP